MKVEGPFFQQQKSCPICGKAFTVTRIRSSFIRVKERKPDFMVVYEGINPLHYQIFVCPNCNYASPDASFDSPQGDVAKIRRGLHVLRSEEPDFFGERSLKVALRSYELAIRTAQITEVPSSVFSALCLRAAWIAKEMDNPELAIQYAEQARQLYEQAFLSERSVGKMSSVALTYLIGELNRQTGNFVDAVRWFSRAVTNPEIKREPEIERLARQQWETARVQAKDKERNGVAKSQPAETPGSAKENEPEALTAKNQPIYPAPATPKKRIGPKIRFTATLYEDQINWLKHLSAIPHKEAGIFMEKETVLRALINAAMEVYPEIEGFTTEDELRIRFLQRMTQSKS